MREELTTDSKGEPLLVEWFESADGWQEYVEVSEKRNKLPYRNYSFQLARKGWTEGADNILEAESLVFGKISSFLKELEISLDVSGAAFDIGVYLEGVPEHWLVLVPRESQAVRIVFSPEVLSTTSGLAANARGAAVIALIRALESQGKRVELWLGFDTTTGRKHYETRILFKRQQDYVSVVDLAFPCCHPEFLRSLEFSNIEFHWETGHLGHGYGGNHGVRMPGDIVLDGSYKDGAIWSDPNKTVDWVIQKLKDQGVEIL